MNNRHINALDGLRGLAAVLVVFSHAANENMLPAALGAELGKVGVLLFFVLSGFLMAYLYGDKPFRHETVRQYLVARIARVFPLFVIVAIANWLAYRSGLGFALPVENLSDHLLLIRGVSVLWTIPVEMHFYVVFLVLWAARAVGVQTFARTATILFIATLLLAMALKYGLGATNELCLPFWLHAFLFGCLVGVWWSQNPEVGLPGWAGVAALVFLFAAAPGLRHGLGLPNFPVWSDPACLIAVASVFLSTLTGALPVLGTRVFRFLGAISYSLYLLHLPVIVGVSVLMGATFGAFLVALALSLIISTASHRWIELPLQSALRTLLRNRNPKATQEQVSQSAKTANP